MGKRGHRISTTYLRDEPKHLDGTGEVEVEYEISAHYIPYRRATRDDPPEGGELEDFQVTRCDPRVGTKHVPVPHDEDPFDKAEWDQIQRQLEEVEAESDEPDEPDPPDYDED